MPNFLKIKQIELEYKKLITEYNGLFIAMITLLIGTATLIYSLSHNIFFTLACFTISMLLLNSECKSTDKKLKSKIKELN